MKNHLSTHAISSVSSSIIILSCSRSTLLSPHDQSDRCSLSPPSVFELLRSEARVMEGLRSLHIETPYIHDILKLNVLPSDTDYAVDIRNPAISVRHPIRNSLI